MIIGVNTVTFISSC